MANAFLEIAKRGYGSDLLPIIPPDVDISAASKNPEGVGKGRGKIPGMKRVDGWVGFHEWSVHATTAAHYEEWGGWGAGVGLRASKFPALDIDVSCPRFVRELGGFLELILGRSMFSRVGRAPRILLPLRAVDGYVPAKIRLTFKLPGIEELQAVELLGHGQQYVLQGIHPGTSLPYRWPRNFPDAEVLPEVDSVTVEKMFDQVRELIELRDGEVIATSYENSHTTRSHRATSAPSLDALRSVLNPALIDDVDYETWIKVCAAVRGACTSFQEEAYEVFEEWSLEWPGANANYIRAKWDSFRPPFSLGWDFLSSWARERGVNVSAYDFDAQPEDDDPEAEALNEMFKRYVWIDQTELIFDLDTHEMLNARRFNVRNNHIANPNSRTNSPLAVWQMNSLRMQKVSGVTYRPGLPARVAEKWGDCVNTWHASDVVPEPGNVDVWLDHAEYLLPNKVERELLFDWMAFVYQQQNVKPNWHVLLGGVPGTGKDALFLPLMNAIGYHNARIVQSEQVLGPYTDWVENARLIQVQELHTFGRRETENRLKPLLTNPPDRLSISKKYHSAYTVPNIAALVFLTNHENALQISNDDRRYFIVWSDAKPRGEEYYSRLFEWLGDDKNIRALAAWFQERRVTTNMQGVAPSTEMKTYVQQESLSPLEEWLSEGVAEATGPFAADLVAVSDIMVRVPARAEWKQATEARMGGFLRRYGARQIGRVRLGRELETISSDRARIYSLRRHEMYASLPPAEIARLFWLQREKVAKLRSGELFDAVG